MSASAAASDRSAVARSSSRKLVTLGCGSQPTSASGREPRPLRLDAGDVRLHLASCPRARRDDRRGDGPDRARRPVDREPGDRLARADGEPDPEPGHRVGLRGRAHRDDVREPGPERDHRGADELAVGLVDDDRGAGRPSAAASAAMPSSSASMVPSGSAGRSGCWGCRPRRGSHRGPRHGPRGRPSPSRRPSTAAGRRSPGRRAARRGPGTWRRWGSR